MTATDVAAWVGAVSGLIAVAWDFYKWKTSGPNLKVSATPGMKIASPHPLAKDDSSYLTIAVSNNGTTKTTIQTLSIAPYESWWARRRLKPSQAGVVPTPLGGPIPFELNVGAQWVGAIKQNKRVEDMLTSGKMWCDIYHSWSKRPTQLGIKPKERMPKSGKSRTDSNF